jgi:glycosyltransferase involved in cell wall biosynthesis
MGDDDEAPAAAAAAAADPPPPAANAAAAAVVRVEVDVIVPVHNASAALRGAVASALGQRRGRDDDGGGAWPPASGEQGGGDDDDAPPRRRRCRLEIAVHVCCYDDGSSDGSWELLRRIAEEHRGEVARGGAGGEEGAASGGGGGAGDAGVDQEEDGAASASAPRRAASVAPAAGDKELAVASCTVRGRTDVQTSGPGPGLLLESHLHVAASPDGASRGAGYARNRAVEMRPALWRRRRSEGRNRPGGGEDDEDETQHHQFLCLLDSDDVMSEHRVWTQVRHLLSLSPRDRARCVLGCGFARDPPDSTWHYARWANTLPEDRLGLERYREVTVVQPTWVRRWKGAGAGGKMPAPLAARSSPSLFPFSCFLAVFVSAGVLVNSRPSSQMMCRSRFDFLGGYLEAPHPGLVGSDPRCESVPAYVRSLVEARSRDGGAVLGAGAPADEEPLVHPTETLGTLRLAEDLRFFHAHLASGGVVRRCDGPAPLVVYRHSGESSQSRATPRRLLLKLRALAFERSVLDGDPRWAGRKFAVWGAGRDGKDFCKALRPDTRRRICCLADVDDAKILGSGGQYANAELGLRIPVVHFSYLARDPEVRERLTRSWRDGLDDDGGAAAYGRVDKRRRTASPPGPAPAQKAPARRRELAGGRGLDLSVLPDLPVVVCVVLNRTNGALERNVELIGRTEGEDLWHFS